MPYLARAQIRKRFFGSVNDMHFGSLGVIWGLGAGVVDLDRGRHD